MSLFAHQKQFVLGPLPVVVRSDWRIVRIAEGLILSHCPKLRIQQLQSNDGVPYWLLGLAVRADEPMSSISDGFQLKDSAEIENWTGFWAGRWSLISAGRCWQDASGCLGIYYRRVIDGLWISSSPALLGDHLPGVPSSARLPWRTAHNKGLDWIPPPYTTREGVYKLLPLRSMEPQSGRMTSVSFTAQVSEAGEDLQTLASTLKTIMINWAHAGFRERFIALTAGLDTRTVLAAAVAAKAEIETFTTVFPITVKRDLVLPPRIASRVRVPHTLRGLPGVDATKLDARKASIAEHLDGITFHPITTDLARCEYGLLNDWGQTVAHGNSFEVGRCFYWDKLSNCGREAQPTDPDHLLACFTFRSSWRPEPAALWREALQAWIDSLREPSPLGLDWRDRFYLDQRLGGWNSILQRSWDMLDGTAFYPGNSLLVFSLLLQFSPAQRKEAFAQREAIRLLAPQLMEIPINPKPISKILRETVRDLLGPRTVSAVKSLAQSSRLWKAP